MIFEWYFLFKNVAMCDTGDTNMYEQKYDLENLSAEFTWINLLFSFSILSHKRHVC